MDGNGVDNMKQQVNLNGIVLSASMQDEFDKRLVILTKERGKVTAFARGARRPGSPLMAISTPFTYASFQCYQSYDAYRIAKAQAVDFFDEMKQNLDDVCYASYFCELADHVTMEGTSDKNLLNLLYVTFKALIKAQMDRALIRRTYELKLLELEGLAPQVFDCVKCGRKNLQQAVFDSASGGILCEICEKQASHGLAICGDTLYTLRHIRTMPLEKLYGFHVSAQVLTELSALCDAYLPLHIDKKCRSLEMLEALS